MERKTMYPDFMVEARREILGALVEGAPLTLPEMPRRWPVTRDVLTFVVRELLGAGLVAPVPGGRIPGRTAYALTDDGRRVARSGVDPLPRSDARDPGRATA